MKTTLSVMIAAMLLGSSAFAQTAPPAAPAAPAKPAAKPAPTMIVFAGPDGKVFEITVDKARTGFKLPKQQVDEKGVRRVVGRFVETIRTHVPQTIGGKECSMDYLKLTLRTTKDKSVPTLTGTHESCKERIYAQGSLVDCKDRVGFKTIVWAGDKEPEKCPTLAAAAPAKAPDKK